MKKILIDLYHLPQYNFFKNTILSLDPSEVDIFCVDRGKLRSVVEYELPGYHIQCIGSYRYNKGMFSMIFRIIIPRIFILFRKMTKKKYRFVITAHYQANFVAKLRGIPNIAFIDDPRKFVFPLLKFSADEVYLPPFERKTPGVSRFNALKEWSYLSPAYFEPDPLIPQAYKLEPKKYVFVREVSTETSNYLAQREGAILSISELLPNSLQIVLSLEKKENASLYPQDWILLEEPVKDIHSLMYFSRIVLSSGDSVAREGAMLGVPSIYAGIREMPANDIMIKKGMLFKIPPENIPETIGRIQENQIPFPEQETIRLSLRSEWEDVTALVLNKLSLN